MIDSEELQKAYRLPEMIANSYITAYDTNGNGGIDREGIRM